MASATASRTRWPATTWAAWATGVERVTVDITNFVFVPDAIADQRRRHASTWVNNDATRHTVTSGTDDTADGTFDSGDVEAGDTFSFTFTEAGDFAYFCDIHPPMTGTVIVAP